MTCTEAGVLARACSYPFVLVAAVVAAIPAGLLLVLFRLGQMCGAFLSKSECTSAALETVADSLVLLPGTQALSKVTATEVV